MTEYEAFFVGVTSEVETGIPVLASCQTMHDQVSSPEEAARLARKLITSMLGKWIPIHGDFLVGTRKVEDHSDLQIWRIVVELKPKVTLLTPYMSALKEEGEL